MGFSQVVLARELTINEIKEISDNTDVSLEFLFMVHYVFVTVVSVI